MLKTMIISAYPGCGKTWLYRHCNKYTCKDIDSSLFDKSDVWEKRYVNHIVDNIGKFDFIFVSQHSTVLKELNLRNIPFVIVAPDNALYCSDEAEERTKERQLIKQQWFGRFLLRDNSHIHDFNSWLKKHMDTYDERTSLEYLTKYKPVSFFLLKHDEYLSDIIDDLYWKKEHINLYVLYQKKAYHTQDINGKSLWVVDLKDINEAPAADVTSKQQWISVEDRVPEKRGEYLVIDAPAGHWVRDNNGYRHFEREPVSTAHWNGERFMNGRYEYITTHWMPLPEPPSCDVN